MGTPDVVTRRPDAILEQSRFVLAEARRTGSDQEHDVDRATVTLGPRRYLEEKEPTLMNFAKVVRELEQRQIG